MNVALDTLALLPEGFVLGGAIVALLAGSFLPRNRQVATRWIAILALLASVVAATAGMTQPSTTVFEASFAVDVGSGFGRIIIALATISVIVLGIEELSGARRESETYALLLLAALGAMLLSGASDLLILVTGYLLTSIPLYALIGMSRSPSAAVAAGVVGVLGGLMFKAGGVPGHFWIPDATQASGTAVAAFLTTVPKIGALIAAYRLLDIIPASIDWPLLVGLLAAASMTLGNLAAFWQDDVRRLLNTPDYRVHRQTHHTRRSLGRRPRLARSHRRNQQRGELVLLPALASTNVLTRSCAPVFSVVQVTSRRRNTCSTPLGSPHSRHRSSLRPRSRHRRWRHPVNRQLSPRALNKPSSHTDVRNCFLPTNIFRPRSHLA
ncbi:proton-conducting transporter membrane subunit [Cryobacterium sp. Y82]|uniref:proton-conducting transporter transmembrane domain-containing protein n=1 Tax=Cryobacterium sp. Y82 TaxID=2045017 RepID=UPI001E3F29AD|nr:proton-conducting transporter membrane subunit [Cryobacterium sp. Y82]